MYVAAYDKARVAQGKKKALSQPSGSVNGFAQSPNSRGLTRLNCKTINKTTRIPVINVGSEVPTNTKTELALSANFPFLRAANIPIDIPTEIH